MTWRPRARELLGDGVLAGAARSRPSGGMPAPSTRLVGRRPRRPLRSHRASARSLVSTRRRSSAGCEERDSAAAIVIWPASHEAGQRGVHRLHAVLRRRSGSASRSGASCPRGSGCARPGSGTSTSAATQRPWPSAVGSSVWVTTPWRPIASCARIWPCCAGGKTSMMRSIVCGASCVWSVAKTRWPVSAAVSAVPIVSMSRISPTRITSGSWRSAALRPSAKDGASGADLALVDDAASCASAGTRSGPRS